MAEACGGVETVDRDIEANEWARRLRVENVKTRTLHNPKGAAPEKAKRTASEGLATRLALAERDTISDD